MPKTITLANAKVHNINLMKDGDGWIAEATINFLDADGVMVYRESKRLTLTATQQTKLDGLVTALLAKIKTDESVDTIE